MNIMVTQIGKVICFFCICTLSAVQVYAQKTPEEIDKQVSKFLKESSASWKNWNVPYEDGKVLFDLIVKNKYTSALEIGTSTGHSTVWLAWAMSKTGGKVITIEVDEGRYKTAKENIKKAGLEQYVDARLADAHDLVKQLPGPLVNFF